MISLCDVNIAKYIRPVWDHRTNVGEGAYSHKYNGGIHYKIYFKGIYPHHLPANQ